MKRLWRWGLGVGLFGLLVWPSACSSSKACTLVGCIQHATAHLSFAGSYADLRSSTFEMCQDALCLSGPLADLPQTPGAEARVTLPALTSASVEVTVRPGASGGFDLEVVWVASVGEDLQDGDLYRIALASPDPQTSLSLSGAVSAYEVGYPNGRDCDPACKSGVIALK